MHFADWTQGVALGYRMSPRWGKDRASHGGYPMVAMKHHVPSPNGNAIK